MTGAELTVTRDDWFRRLVLRLMPWFDDDAERAQARVEDRKALRTERIRQHSIRLRIDLEHAAAEVGIAYRRVHPPQRPAR